MAVTVTNSQRKAKVSTRTLKASAESALSHLGLGGAELSVLVTGDRKMRALNRVYRGIDRTTDVLSFSPSGSGIKGKDVPPKVLGDIAISAPKALEQAEERGHSFEDEMLFLLVHGILHLAGYDHEGSSEEKKRMDRAHRGVMKALKAG